METPGRALSVLAACAACRSDGSPLGPVTEPDDNGMEHILAVHSQAFVEHSKTLYTRWISEGGNPDGALPECWPARCFQKFTPSVGGTIAGNSRCNVAASCGHYCYDMSCVVTADTWQAVYWSAQTAISTAKYLQQQQALSAAFALCRPPGHHCHDDMMGGYCFINNAAIAAQILCQDGKRVAIIDIDYHHGNGTQDIFYSRSDVLFLSLHGNPDRAYPYFSGSAAEVGEGEGVGYTINVPLPAGCSDEAYTSALKNAMARVVQYAPDYVVVSLGIDTFIGDPLGDFCITREGYSAIGQIIGALRVPTMYVMEGGYVVPELGNNVCAVLLAHEQAAASQASTA